MSTVHAFQNPSAFTFNVCMEIGFSMGTGFSSELDVNWNINMPKLVTGMGRIGVVLEVGMVNFSPVPNNFRQLMNDFLIMPFGLTCVPSVFQRLMDNSYFVTLGLGSCSVSTFYIFPVAHSCLNIRYRPMVGLGETLAK